MFCKPAEQTTFIVIIFVVISYPGSNRHTGMFVCLQVISPEYTHYSRLLYLWTFLSSHRFVHVGLSGQVVRECEAWVAVVVPPLSLRCMCAEFVWAAAQRFVWRSSTQSLLPGMEESPYTPHTEIRLNNTSLFVCFSGSVKFLSVLKILQAAHTATCLPTCLQPGSKAVLECV